MAGSGALVLACSKIALKLEPFRLASQENSSLPVDLVPGRGLAAPPPQSHAPPHIHRT
jgi:hypothetical protein